VRAQLDKLLRDALRLLEANEQWTGLADADPQLERTRDPRHGDFTSNIAMRVAKSFATSPRDFAAAVIRHLEESSLVEQVEIAGPGFINFTLSASAYHHELKRVLESKSDYGCNDIADGRRVLVEYVSANPTGPLHVGHGRHAAHGASIASLLRATGHVVDEEYYVNDAGRQMDILAASVWLRYAEQRGHPIPFPSNAYQGEYVRDISRQLSDSHGDAFLADPSAVAEVAETAAEDDEQRLDSLIGAIKHAVGEERFAAILAAALDSVLTDIKEDLQQFGITPQRWYSERSLVESKAVDKALKVLDDKQLLYKKEGATWFRSSNFGDDKDRVVIRENGATTYLASDIAYHLDKCDRGYELLLNVLGSDHHGYVARIRAGVEAMDRPASSLEVELVQFVILYRGQVKAQMSTRSGDYVTLRELRDEVGTDAARFFYVSRSNDQHLDFDMELAKSRSNDNPVYYVQYAHARIVSMLRRMEGEGVSPPNADEMNLEALDAPEEQALMIALSRYPEMVQLAAENRAPQHIVHYLRDLASDFHSYYNAHRILVDDDAIRGARVILALAVQQVIRNALTLLGVSAPASM